MTNSITYIGLINPKSPDNVGAVMRSAGNFRVDSVFYTGSRYPMAIKNMPRTLNVSRKIGKTVPLLEGADFIDNVPEGVSVVCIELVENAISLPEFTHPDHVLYIFGPEDGSISQKIIDKADAVVYIPTVGCMNLAATVNVVLYDRTAKLSQQFGNNELIRKSRDINNSLVVKE